MREKLIALSMVKKGDWNEVYNFLQRDRKLSSIDDVVAFELVDQLKYDVVTIMDDDYPIVWREMPKPPLVIYLKGNRELLNRKVIAVVGGKVASEYTRKAVCNLIKRLPNCMSVATGFEHGVEICVNEYATSRIISLASGFDVDDVYRKHEVYGQLTSDDLVMSERPPNGKFNLQSYYRAYHLIAELSQAVCVFELAGFDLRVKHLNYLTEIGKEVIVLPDQKNRFTEGGLGLINLGAKCLLQVGDVLDLI